MKKCNDDCIPCCDFCKHFDSEGYYDGEGKCLIKNEDVQFSGYCDEFHCFRVKQGELDG